MKQHVTLPPLPFTTVAAYLQRLAAPLLSHLRRRRETFVVRPTKTSVPTANASEAFDRPARHALSHPYPGVRYALHARNPSPATLVRYLRSDDTPR
ncbi:hypothetical protein BV22DRAFT_1036716, partial [Leucogyrophana mollusca]